MVDWFGTLSGVVAGAAFAPFSPKARAEWLVTGATKGVGGTLKATSSVIGGTGGYALQGTPGLTKGVSGGIGTLPQMAGEELKKGTVVLGTGLTLWALAPYIAIGVLVLIVLMRK